MKKVLLILHYCPPVYGSNVVGSLIKDSKKINTRINAKYIKIKSSLNLDKVGRYEFKKILYMIELYLASIYQLIVFHPENIYFTPSIKGAAFYRDFMLSFFLKFYCSLFNKNLYYHYHTKGISKFVQNSKFKRKLMKLFLKNVNLILISEMLKYDLAGLNSYKKLHYLNNGISNKLSEQEFKEILSQRYNSETINILFLSNLKETKGTLDAYYAFKNVCNANAGSTFNIKLNYIGGFSEPQTKRKLEEMILEHGLQDHVKILGPKFDEDKKKYLAESHILLFPTFYEKESFPLVILESMQFGLPVISTYEGGIPEIIDDETTGFLVPKNNIELFAQKLEYLVNNKEERKKMGLSGRSKYLKYFQTKNFEENFLKIIR